MALCRKARTATSTVERENTAGASHPYVGAWATEDGFIRQNLLANGRYEEARGPRRDASRGRYSVANDCIEYVEDAGGFTARGRFEGGVLYHDGMRLYRREGESQPT